MLDSLESKKRERNLNYQRLQTPYFRFYEKPPKNNIKFGCFCTNFENWPNSTLRRQCNWHFLRKILPLLVLISKLKNAYMFNDIFQNKQHSAKLVIFWSIICYYIYHTYFSKLQFSRLKTEKNRKFLRVRQTQNLEKMDKMKFALGWATLEFSYLNKRLNRIKKNIKFKISKKN